MRCIKCGKETDLGYWGSGGFICSSCSESYGYLPCERCGTRYPSSEMKEYGGGRFCASCYKGMAPKPPPPKPKAPAKAAAPVRLPARREKLTTKGPIEITPGEVNARAARILGVRDKEDDVSSQSDKEEGKGSQKDSLFRVLSAIKDVIKGKKDKKKKYSVDIK